MSRETGDITIKDLLGLQETLGQVIRIRLSKLEGISIRCPGDWRAHNRCRPILTAAGFRKIAESDMGEEWSGDLRQGDRIVRLRVWLAPLKFVVELDS